MDPDSPLSAHASSRVWCRSPFPSLALIPSCRPLVRGLMSLFSLDILEPSLLKSTRSQSPRIPLQTLASSHTAVSSDTTSSSPSKQPRKTNGEAPQPGPPRWNTPEFWFYGLVFVLVCPMMVYCTVDLSRGTSPNLACLLIWAADKPNYKKYVDLLSEGWIFGRKVVSLPPMNPILSL
jgi:protein-cysteine N-palmitoyltransferase HHAT